MRNEERGAQTTWRGWPVDPFLTHTCGSPATGQPRRHAKANRWKLAVRERNPSGLAAVRRVP
jgi:hypothetical protein